MNTFRINKKTTYMDWTCTIFLKEHWSNIVAYNGGLLYDYCTADNITLEKSRHIFGKERMGLTYKVRKLMFEQLSNNLRVWL